MKFKIPALMFAVAASVAPLSYADSVAEYEYDDEPETVVTRRVYVREEPIVERRVVRRIVEEPVIRRRVIEEPVIERRIVRREEIVPVERRAVTRTTRTVTYRDGVPLVPFNEHREVRGYRHYEVD